MVQVPQRTALSGPTLIRLLARVADLDVPESRQSLSDRLSQWLNWTDAIALSSALNGSPPAVTASARVFGSAEEAECARVRAALARSIAGESALTDARRRMPAHTPSAGTSIAAVDYALFRQRYVTLQQSMENAIGTLRGRLRQMLAARTPALARLAVVDAVMERALGAREQTLLAGVPALLGGHFERLRAGAPAADVDAEAGMQAGAKPGEKPGEKPGATAEAVAEATAGTTSEAAAEFTAQAATADTAHPAARPAASANAWLEVFRKDMQSVLLAELELRFQPVEGLLAALRAC